MTVDWSRELPSDPSSVRIYHDTLGRWWCSFVVAVGVEELPATGRSICVDWGVKELATTPATSIATCGIFPSTVSGRTATGPARGPRLRWRFCG